MEMSESEDNFIFKTFSGMYYAPGVEVKATACHALLFFINLPFTVSLNVIQVTIYRRLRLAVKCAFNQPYIRIKDLHFTKYELFSRK